MTSHQLFVIRVLACLSFLIIGVNSLHGLPVPRPARTFVSEMVLTATQMHQDSYDGIICQSSTPWDLGQEHFEELEVEGDELVPAASSKIGVPMGEPKPQAPVSKRPASLPFFVLYASWII